MLADGSSYSFLYNSYGEVSQVTLPTGGVYQYIWPKAATFCTDGTGDGYQSSNYTIYRRVLERDEFPGGAGTTPTLRTIFSASPTTAAGPEGTSIPSTDVTVSSYGSTGALLREEVHHYWGDPTNANAVPADPLAYPSWTDGVEIGNSVIDTNGSTVLSTVQNTWQQRPCISSSENCWISDLSAPTARLNDPRLCQTLTTLGSGTSGTESFYDSMVPWNRQTDLFEFEYGNAPAAGCPSSQPTSGYVRHTNTSYNNDSAHIAPGVNLTQLPSQRTVYNSSGAQAAYESWTYDEAGTLTAASGLATGSHDDADYGTGTTWRGDLTTHTVWKNLPSGVNYSEHFTWDTVCHASFCPLAYLESTGVRLTDTFENYLGQLSPTHFIIAPPPPEPPPDSDIPGFMTVPLLDQMKSIGNGVSVFPSLGSSVSRRRARRDFNVLPFNCLKVDYWLPFIGHFQVSGRDPAHSNVHPRFRLSAPIE